MIQVTLSQYHIPQLCKCKSHNATVFTQNHCTILTVTHKEALLELARWFRVQGNGKDACWVYRVEEVKEVD